MIRRHLLLLLASAFVLCCAAIPDAVARPGVDHTSGGGLHPGQSMHAHRGYQESETIDLVFPLVIAGIFVAVVLSLIVIGIGRTSRSPGKTVEGRRQSDQDTDDGGLECGLRELVSDDPDFSAIAFLDFAHALWHETRLRTGTPQLQYLRPYYSMEAMERLAPEGLTASQEEPRDRSMEGRIDEVVIRGLRIDRIVRRRFVGPLGGAPLPAEVFRLVVVLEDSWRLLTSQGPLRRQYEDVKLVFERAVGVRSKTPDRQFVVCCQSCSGTLPDELGERCPYCGQDYRSPGFNWHCTEVVLRTREIFTIDGQDVTASVVGPGYHLPTRSSPTLAEDLEAMERDEPDFRVRFLERAMEVFAKLYESWDAADLEGMRPLLTERLSGTYRFWIEGYREAGLLNHLGKPRIISLELARIERDRWFDAVTVRLKSSCFNEVVEAETGRLVSGSRRYPQYHSEYWTFARPAARGEQTPIACPRCGAMHVPQQDVFCAFCGSRIVVSAAAWVLSLIEQADAVRPGELVSDGTEEWRRLWPPKGEVVRGPAPAPLPPLLSGPHADAEEQDDSFCRL